MVKIESGSLIIVRNPRIQGGGTVIRGTRVPVRSIVIAAEEYGGDLTRVGPAFSVEAVPAA